MRALGLTAILLLFATCSPAIAREVIYSDTCVEQESGDVAGYVVTFTDAKGLPIVNLSWSEGSLKGPVQANVTDFDRRSGRLAFSVRTSYGEFLFKGKIGANVIEGALSSPFEDSSQHIKLTERSHEQAVRPVADCQ